MDSSKDGIGRRIALLRNIMNLTQEQLGKIVGLSRKQISSIECGVSDPKVSTLLQFSAFFRCSTDYILKGEEFKTIDFLIPDDILQEIHTNEDEQDRFMDYVNLYIKTKN